MTAGYPGLANERILLQHFRGNLAQAEHGVAPLPAALDGVIGYISSFAAAP